MEITKLEDGDVTVVLVKFPFDTNISGAYDHYRIYLYDLETDDDGATTLHEWQGTTATTKDPVETKQDIAKHIIGMITGIGPSRSASKGNRFVKPKKNKIKDSIREIFAR